MVVKAFLQQRTTAVLVSLIVLVVSLSVAAQRRSQGTAKKTVAAKPSVDKEALREANKLADAMLTKCDNGSFYAYLDGNLVEWKGRHVKLEPETVSAADALNGIKYHVTVKISFDARRDRAGMWETPVTQYCLTLEKRVDGSWEPGVCLDYLRDIYDGIPPKKKPTCGQVARRL